MINIYTDGACSVNPGVGGWGAVIIYDSGKEEKIYGSDPETTNNRMEITAVIKSLEKVNEKIPSQNKKRARLDVFKNTTNISELKPKNIEKNMLLFGEFENLAVNEMLSYPSSENDFYYRDFPLFYRKHALTSHLLSLVWFLPILF